MVDAWLMMDLLSLLGGRFALRAAQALVDETETERAIRARAWGGRWIPDRTERGRGSPAHARHGSVPAARRVNAVPAPSLLPVTDRPGRSAHATRSGRVSSKFNWRARTGPHPRSTASRVAKPFA